MTDKAYESWEPLLEIAGMLTGVSYNQLTEWERRRKTNGFPEPKQTLGRYKFFDPEEVKQWVHLYQKVTKNLKGNGKRLKNNA